MKITKVQMKKGDWGNTKAMVSVTFDDCFVVSGLKVIEGQNGAFVSMPNRKTADGEYIDTCFPITKEFRQELIDAVLKEYGAESGTTADNNSEYQF